MISRTVILFYAILVSGSGCFAQQKSAPMPDKLVIAQRTFFDFGPPFNYYELISVTPAPDGLAVERLLVTPEGQACVQPAKVESRTAKLQGSMETLLRGKNPCAIPEKELHRELKRCKHCLTFSGVNVTMLANCAGKDRQIRMDILDRDLFDPRVVTPENTSWTMQILSEIGKATGAGAMDEPMFSTSTEMAARTLPDTQLFHELQDGKFNTLFLNEATLSEAIQELGETPPPPPSIELIEAVPFSAVEVKMPKMYPPIARLARIEGTVTLQVNIDSSGKAVIRSADGQKMLHDVATEAIKTWTFPEAALGHSEEIKMQFKLNCAPHVHTNVN